MLTIGNLKVRCDMQFSDLQGKKNPGTDSRSVESFLGQVKKAKEMKIDRLYISHAPSLFLSFYENTSMVWYGFGNISNHEIQSM